MTPDEEQQMKIEIRNRLDQEKKGVATAAPAAPTTQPELQGYVAITGDEEQKLKDEVRQQIEQKKLAEESLKREVGGQIADKNDGVLAKAWKYPAAALRGTGEGLATMIEAPRHAAEWAGNLGAKALVNAFGGDYKAPPGSGGWPLTDAYNAVMPAPPQGYENTNDVASVVGPAVVGTALTGGFAAPEFAATAFPEAVSSVAGPVLGAVRGGINTATNMAAGYMGGEAAKAGVSQFTDNPDALAAAQAVGSFVAPAVTSGVRPSIGSYFVDQKGPSKSLTSAMDVAKSFGKSIAPTAGLGYLGLPVAAGGVAPAIAGLKYLRDLPFKDIEARRLFTYDHGLQPNPATLPDVMANATVGATADQNSRNKPLVRPSISGPNGWLSNFGRQ